MLWSKKTTPTPSAERSRLVGLHVTSSRIRGLTASAGHTRPLSLDWPNEELQMFLSLEKRSLEVGLAGYAICRKLPHLVCSNFLAQLGQAREWRNGRTVLSPESAWSAVCEKIRGPIVAESDGCAFALPTYLASAQVKTIVELGTKAKLPIRGTASSALAVAAHRAAAILNAEPPAESSPLKIRPRNGGSGAVVIVDIDEYALSAAVVNVEPTEVRLVSVGVWPKLSLRVWKDRLIDAIADRCVRLCRRDLRDSAIAEQSLYEQLDPGLEKVRAAQNVTFSIRTDKWYQDVPQTPGDFDSHVSALATTAAENVRDLVSSANTPSPPIAVWLTDTTAKLPAFAAKLYRQSAEQTELAALPPDAITEAAAALHARFLTAELPSGHLDGVIPLETPAAKAEPRLAAKRS